jgi:hypothetical protein
MGVLAERPLRSSASQRSCASELRLAQIAEPARLQIDDIDQRHEMHALPVEAVPAAVAGLAAEAFVKQGAGRVVQDVVLAGNEMDGSGLQSAQELLGGVEFGRFRQMADVAGVDDEIGLPGQPVDLGDGGLQGPGAVGIGLLGKADVAVADLHEGHRAVSSLGGGFGGGRADQPGRPRNAAGDRP